MPVAPMPRLITHCNCAAKAQSGFREWTCTEHGRIKLPTEPDNVPNSFKAFMQSIKPQEQNHAQ